MVKKRRKGMAPSTPKILCLGMSYPDVEAQLEHEGYAKDLLAVTTPSVAQAVELVRRNVLTEMDGRDLARCRAMEEKNKVKAYTVSQESGARYDPRYHLNANFNRSNFDNAVKRAFGKDVRFRQIILDYFWIPSGAWVMSHWSRNFFRTTLPNFVHLLEYRPAQKREEPGYGVVYLPFCLHCVKEIIASIDVLQNYYRISFLQNFELDEHALWAGTMTIDRQTMQEWLGKNIAQEDIYCTFTPRDVFEGMDDANVTKQEVVKVLQGIDKFATVRMIRLEPLAKYNPRNRSNGRAGTVRNEEVGGFVGLKSPKMVRQGFDSLLPSFVSGKGDLTDSTFSEDESDSDDEAKTIASLRRQIEAPKARGPGRPRKETSSLQILKRHIPKRRLRRRTKTRNKHDLTHKQQTLYYVVPDTRTYHKLGKKGKDEVTNLYKVPMEVQHCQDTSYAVHWRTLLQPVLIESDGDDQHMHPFENESSRNELQESASIDKDESSLGGSIDIDMQSPLKQKQQLDQFRDNREQCPQIEMQSKSKKPPKRADYPEARKKKWILNLVTNRVENVALHDAKTENKIRTSRKVQDPVREAESEAPTMGANMITCESLTFRRPLHVPHPRTQSRARERKLPLRAKNTIVLDQPIDSFPGHDATRRISLDETIGGMMSVSKIEENSRRVAYTDQRDGVAYVQSRPSALTGMFTALEPLGRIETKTDKSQGLLYAVESRDAISVLDTSASRSAMLYEDSGHVGKTATSEIDSGVIMHPTYGQQRSDYEFPGVCADSVHSKTLDNPGLSNENFHITVMDFPPLVEPEDLPLIAEYIYLTLEQMKPCTLVAADKIGRHYATRNVGFPGLACKYCDKDGGTGRFFPASESALSQTNTIATISNHVMTCKSCPVEVRETLETMARIRLDSDCKGQRVERKPKYGGRKEFIRRLWLRIQGLPWKEEANSTGSEDTNPGEDVINNDSDEKGICLSSESSNSPKRKRIDVSCKESAINSESEIMAPPNETWKKSKRQISPLPAETIMTANRRNSSLLANTKSVGGACLSFEREIEGEQETQATPYHDSNGVDQHHSTATTRILSRAIRADSGQPFPFEAESEVLIPCTPT